ncbi:MAG: tRNA (adenosine(37)-N6)-threonylcarbamoyltransferase complex dimerization subunit type 1 TsaB [Actinobacteria bacterium]|nr:tRNA (adenosine(37)-N6)-threonylcarbamoyltransferase complex dimerization subunit type 1 TsaB [Actinomycetota bacterium]
MILGIDTSLGTTVAVVEADGVVRSEVGSTDPLRHAEVIGSLLARALTEASGAAAVGVPAPSVPRLDLTHVAAGMGPGPFTGLRIGVAAARAFALGRGIPVVAVVSHDAIALGHLLHAALQDADTPRFAVVTDARRREFAYTVYDGIDDDGLPVRVTEPALVPRDDLDARLNDLGAERREAHSVSGAMLALVAARALAGGRETGPAEPLYLRSPDVTLGHAPKRVTA